MRRKIGILVIVLALAPFLPIGTYAEVPAVSDFCFPAAPASQPFTFTALGDTGDATPEQLAIASRMIQETPAFVLHAGDMQFDQSRDDRWQAAYFTPYASILSRTCIFHAIGNHDLEIPGAYFSHLALPHNNPRNTKEYYSFDYGNTHFVSLNSNQNLRSDVGPPHDTDFAQLTWLRNDLVNSWANTTIKWRIIFFHGAAYSTGVRAITVPDDTPGQVMRRDYTPVFEQYGVDLVIQAHDLDYERTCQVRQGVCFSGAPLYLVTGGGGYSPLTAQACSSIDCPWIRVFASVHHYVKVIVGSVNIQVQAIDINGLSRDFLTIIKER